MTNKEVFELKDRANDITLLVDFAMKFASQRVFDHRTDVFQFADNYLNCETVIPPLLMERDIK